MLKFIRHSQRFGIQCKNLLQLNKIELNCNHIDGNGCSLHTNIMFRTKNDKTDDKKSIQQSNRTPVSSITYELFDENKSTVILDIEEEREKLLSGELEIEEVDESSPSPYEKMNTTRKLHLDFKFYSPI